MSFARRAGIALAVAGSALTLAAATRAFSPGYTYRMRISGQATEASGKTREYVVLSGHAMVTSKAGRLDIDSASRERGAMAEQGGYILYDPTSMMIVSPKDKQILKFTFDDLEKGMSALAASVPGMRIAITDVVVNLEKLGPGEPMLGMATTRYRVTQDYKLAMKVAFVNRNSTEHIVQDYWMADQKSGFANPFARMGNMRPVGGSAFAELMTKTAEATARMGKGIPVKTVTTTTSTNDKDEKTTNVATMEVTELKAGNVDDALLVPPADYQVMDMGEQTKAMAAQMEQAKAAQAAQASQPPTAAADSGPSVKEAAKKTAEQAAKDEMSQKVKKGLGGLFRRP
ncbi:MAG: hypothetical protein DMD35_06640 [Gemmatimonadetes bacterium]|nr:MAG: hypothetical protein DMD35_06640 [Gemmatimonadota bacterium]